jgi:hypothetical protein
MTGVNEQRNKSVPESTAEGFSRALAALLSGPSGVSPAEEKQIKDDFALARKRARLIVEGVLDPLST